MYTALTFSFVLLLLCICVTGLGGGPFQIPESERMGAVLAFIMYVKTESYVRTKCAGVNLGSSAKDPAHWF